MFKGLFVDLIAMWLHGHLNRNFRICTEYVLSDITKMSACLQWVQDKLRL